MQVNMPAYMAMAATGSPEEYSQPQARGVYDRRIMFIISEREGNTIPGVCMVCTSSLSYLKERLIPLNSNNATFLSITLVK